MESYQLYYFASCPYCIKVRVMLWLMGVKLPLRNIYHGYHGEKNKSALLEGGGKLQVPCLRIESADGKVKWLYESADIIAYFKNTDVRN